MRPLIVKDEDYDEFKDHLYNQNLGGRWLPEIRENNFLFADEMYLDYVKHVPNYVKISFVIECEQNQQDEISEEIEKDKNVKVDPVIIREEPTTKYPQRRKKRCE